MTIHYHGTPITPRAVLHTLAGKHFCVSFAAPQDVVVCHDIGQSVMLDNGAFSVWRRGLAPDWPGYYAWCDRWLDYPSTWAVIPDVIDGSEEENDALIDQWPFMERSVPVWHLHESIDRLRELIDNHNRVCFGSSGAFAVVGSDGWHRRVTIVFNELFKDYSRIPPIHMLRGMSLAGSHYPFASLDSTDVARNHNRLQNSARAMADLWDAQQCARVWVPRLVQAELMTAGTGETG